LGEVLQVRSHATVGVVVAGVFASSMAGQTLLQRAAGSKALPIGCFALAAGMSLVALALIVESLALLIAGGVVAALGQGLSFRAGLTAVNDASPPERRAEVASSFFVIAYVAISVPVVGSVCWPSWQASGSPASSSPAWSPSLRWPRCTCSAGHLQPDGGAGCDRCRRRRVAGNGMTRASSRPSSDRVRSRPADP
jgi:MFS family permease